MCDIVDFEKMIDESLKSIKDIAGEPRIAIIPGFELGELVYEIENLDIIDYCEIPNLPQPLVEACGNLIVGNIQGKRVICIQNDFKNFQRCSEKEIKFCIMLLKKMGVKFLIISNPVVSINKDFNLGDLIIIKNHIDISGNDIVYEQSDIAKLNKQDMLELAETIAEIIGIDIREGIYGDIMFDQYGYEKLKLSYPLDCDIIGISTLSEIIIANSYGMNVLEISCITDILDDMYILDNKIKHFEQNKTYQKSREEIIALVKEIIAVL